MNNLFICNSSYQILISAIMCELYYGKDNNTLLFDEYLYNTISKIMSSTYNTFFENIVCAHSQSLKKDISILFSKYNYDRIHIFNWGNSCSRYIYETYSSEFIALDEGLGSYRLFDIWNDQGIDLLKLNTVYLLDPSLSSDYEYGLNIKSIDVYNLISTQSRWEIFLRKVNRLFGYNPINSPSVIYFDRYFVSENTLPYVYEQFFLNQLLRILASYDYGIKIHPSESNELAKLRYGIHSNNILENTVVPWELVLMNRDKDKPLVLLSINSTPIILSKYWGILLNIPITSITLIDLVRDYIDQQELYIEPLVDHYNAIHPENSVLRAKNFYDVESKLEIAFSSAERNVLSSPVNNFDQYELSWLRSQIKMYSKLFGNLIAILQISLFNGKKHIVSLKKVFTYVNGLIDANVKLNGIIVDCNKIEVDIKIPNLTFSIRKYEITSSSFSYKGICVTNSNKICFISDNSFPAFNSFSIHVELEKPLISFDYTQL